MSANIDENLRHEKMQAEIVDLQQKVNESIQRVSESTARTAKINAETIKIGSENRWYPAVIASGATLAIVGIAKLFL